MGPQVVIFFLSHYIGRPTCLSIYLYLPVCVCILSEGYAFILETVAQKEIEIDGSHKSSFFFFSLSLPHYIYQTSCLSIYLSLPVSLK